MDCGPPGSSVHGTSRARVLQWVPVAFPKRALNSVDVLLEQELLTVGLTVLVVS